MGRVGYKSFGVGGGDDSSSKRQAKRMFVYGCSVCCNISSINVFCFCFSKFEERMERAAKDAGTFATDENTENVRANFKNLLKYLHLCF